MGFLDGYKTYDSEKEGYGNPFEWKRAFYKRMTSDEAILILKEEDPFIILEVSKNATKQEIKIAFRKLANKWHPDKNLDQVEKATEMMKKINAAYCLLK